MATESRKLTLRIDGHRITADRFRRAVEAFFDLVSDVAAEVTGQASAVEWIVSVKPGSINLAASAESKKPSARVTEVVYAVYTGFQELAQKRPERPAYFSDRALEHARELVKLQDGKAVSTVQIWRRRNRVTLNETVSHNVDRILGTSLVEIGTIEGKLDMISARGGSHLGVWDSLTDKVVRCNIRPEQLASAMAAFRKRVAVSGTIRYRTTGDPASVDVEQIEVFPDASRLPTADSVYGIFSKT